MSETQALAVVNVNNYAVIQAGQDELRGIMEANVGVGGVSDFDLERLRVPAGGGRTWEVPGLAGPEPAKSVEGVIVAWRSPRAYWANPLDTSGGGAPPDCSSVDSITGIGTPGGPCVDCALARFGSAPPKDGIPGRGQACKQTRLLFLVRENDMLPLVVVVPPSSLKTITRYFLQLASRKVPFYSVVTGLGLEKTKNRGGIEYSQIQPRLVSQLDTQAAETFKAYGESVARLFSRVGVMADDVHAPSEE